MENRLSPEIIEKINAWIDDATESEPNDPTAVCLATVDKEGMPDIRMVMARVIDDRGIAFFTNYTSKKASDLAANENAALCFHWKSRLRQIRLIGKMVKTSEAESDDYFNARPRDSRIGAWASNQSSPMTSRQDLLDRVAAFTKQFDGIENPPRPPHWGGYRLIPHKVEFWQQEEFRLHTRLVYTKNVYTKNDNEWIKEILYP